MADCPDWVPMSLYCQPIRDAIKAQHARREAELDLAIHMTCSGIFDWVDDC